MQRLRMQPAAYLDIAVDTALSVYVVQPFQNLLRDGCNHRLFQTLPRGCGQVSAAGAEKALQGIPKAYLSIGKLHDVQHGPARNIRHHHPEVLSVHKGAVERQHVSVGLLPHCLGFPHYLVLHQQHFRNVLIVVE